MIHSLPWITIFGHSWGDLPICKFASPHSWGDLPMIFTRYFVTRGNHWQITSLVTKVVIHGNSCIMFYFLQHSSFKGKMHFIAPCAMCHFILALMSWPNTFAVIRLIWKPAYITVLMTSHNYDGVSNHWYWDCFINSYLCRLTEKRFTGSLREDSICDRWIPLTKV